LTKGAPALICPLGKSVNHTFNLHEAKTQLSRLVDPTAAGEEIVIAARRVPQAWYNHEKSENHNGEE
jgi:hypothetical protein